MNISKANDSIQECWCSDIQDPPEGYEIYNFFVIIIGVPILASFGMCTNTANLFVYSQKHMRKVSGNVYLAALAASDFFVVFTGIFLIWMDSARTYLYSLQSVLVSSLFMLTLGNMAQTMSVYFTIGAALDCYVKVRFRRRFSRLWCHPRAAFGVVLVILLFAVGFNLPRFWMFFPNKCRYAGSDEIVNQICPTDLFFKIMLSYNVYATAAIMTFLPFGLLLLLNVLIIKRARALRIEEEQNPDPTQDDEDDGSTTVTLVMVVVMFLVCNTLSLIITVVETFFEISNVSINYMSDMSNLLVIFNSSVNYVIYIYFDREYRRCFLRLVCHEKYMQFNAMGAMFMPGMSPSTGHRVPNSTGTTRGLATVIPNNDAVYSNDNARRMHNSHEYESVPVIMPVINRYMDDSDVFTPMSGENAI